jgi:hypothetical protein
LFKLPSVATANQLQDGKANAYPVVGEIMQVKFLTCLLSGLCLIFHLSTAFAWEPSEPEGATPLIAEQIKAAFAGHVFNGTNLDYVDQHFKDGRLKGEFGGGNHYTGKWWVEEKDNYLCQQTRSQKHCYNVARDKDGNFCLYLWGSDRLDVCGTLEAIPD